jgi:UPF0755 protein
MEDFQNEFNQPGHPMSTDGHRMSKVFFRLFGIFLIFCVFAFLFFTPPSDFSVGKIFKIEDGNSLHSVSLKLKEEGFIRSRVVFEALVILLGREKGVVAGNYYFENKISVYEVAKRIARGEYHLAPISVTIPEGFNNQQIADTFTGKLSNFDKNKFLLQAKELQGSLFPDTYFFLTTDDEDDVIKLMVDNFNKKFNPLISSKVVKDSQIDAYIVMASILEEEAKNSSDAPIISGILWKRISIHMPLQVDAAPDTYKKQGLPLEPISNPGLVTLNAAINPEKSPYLYYLHDKNGNVHYAKTFTEHNTNIRKYLR